MAKSPDDQGPQSPSSSLANKLQLASFPVGLYNNANTSSAKNKLMVNTHEMVGLKKQLSDLYNCDPEDDDSQIEIVKYKEWNDNLFCLPATGYITGALVGTTMGSSHAYWKLLHNSCVAPPSLQQGFFSFSKKLLHTAAAATTTITTKLVLDSGLETGRRFGVFLGVAGLIYPSIETGVDWLRAWLSWEEFWIPGQRDGDILNATMAGFCVGATCKALSGPRASVTGVSVKAMSAPRATALAGAVGAVAALVGKPLTRKLRGASTKSV